MRSATKTRRVYSLFATLLLGFLAVLALMPFFFLLISSFKPGQEMVRNGLQFKFDFHNYSLVNYRLLYTERDGIYRSRRRHKGGCAIRLCGDKGGQAYCLYGYRAGQGR